MQIPPFTRFTRISMFNKAMTMISVKHISFFIYYANNSGNH